MSKCSWNVAVQTFNLLIDRYLRYFGCCQVTDEFYWVTVTWQKKDEKDDGEEDKGETEVKCRKKCVCVGVS